MNRYENNPAYVTVYPELGGKGYTVALPDGIRLPAITKIVITDDFVGSEALVEVTMLANFAAEPLVSDPPPYLQALKKLENDLTTEQIKSNELEFLQKEVIYAQKTNEALVAAIQKERQKWWYRLFSSL